jgi:membrane dipeptidase
LTARPRLVVDLHCDTLLALWERGDELARTGGHLDLGRLVASPVALQVFAVFVPPRFGEDRGLRVALELVERFWREMEAHSDVLVPVRWREDLDRLGPERVGGLLALEGGDVLADTPTLLDVLFRLGVRALALTWNGRNRLADGALDPASRGGLSALGKAVVRRAQALGMLLDVSHASDRAFWEIVAESSGPLVASHSNARAVTEHPRNLTDDMLRALATRGGVVGLNLHAPFLTQGQEADWDDLFRHLDHLLAVAGEDAVALGSDFDGIPTPPRGMPDVVGFHALLEEMARRGWSEERIAKVAGRNAERVLRQVLPKGEGTFAL